MKMLDADALSKESVSTHELGYNCAETILLTFSKALGIDDRAFAKVATPFGGGIGHLCQECGVLTGGIMALGLRFGRTDPSDKVARDRSYEIARSYYDHFRQRFGSVRCIDIQGHNLLNPEELSKFQDERYEICTRVIREGARILANILNEFEL